MAKDSMWEMQKALYSTLNADVALGALVAGIYDYVPEGTNYPYVVIGDISSQAWYSRASGGSNIDVEIKVFTNARSSKDCMEIISLINELLHNASLALTGHDLINVSFDSSQITQINNGEGYLAAAKFKAITEEI